LSLLVIKSTLPLE